MPLFAAPAMHLTDVPLKLAEIWSMPGAISKYLGRQLMSPRRNERGRHFTAAKT